MDDIEMAIEILADRAKELSERTGVEPGYLLRSALARYEVAVEEE